MSAMYPRFNPDGARTPGCFHQVSLIPALWEKRHISEIVEETYDGPYNDFEWTYLALNPPTDFLGTSETEEDANEIWFTFRTTEPYEAIRFVSRIASRFPSLNVRHDYEDVENELFGRLWYRNASLYKQCHLTELSGFLRGI